MMQELRKNRKKREWMQYMPPLLMVLLPALYHACNVRAAFLANGDGLPVKLYGLLVTLLLLGTGGFLAWDHGRRPPLHRRFFAAAWFLGLLYMAVMPGLSAPDELSHYSTVYRLSSRLIGAPELTENAGLIAVRERDYPLEDMEGVKTPECPEDVEAEPSVMGNPVINQSYRSAIRWERRYHGSDRPVSSALPDVRTTPVMYLPQALGFALVRLFGGGSMLLLFAGKCFNLLVYCILVSWAIRVTPVGKALFFGAGMLPMSLHLASSLSYDAGIIGTVFLFSALVLSLRFCGNRTKNPWEQPLLLCVLAAAFSPCKLVYFPLAALVFLLPETSCGGRRKKRLFLLSVLFSAGFSMLIVNSGVLFAYAAPEHSSSAAAIVEAGRGQYTAGELLSHPFFLFRMVFDSFSLQSGTLLGGVVGERLGNLDPLLGAPAFLVGLYWLGLWMLGLGTEDSDFDAHERLTPSGVLREREKLGVAMLLLSVMLLTAGAMLLTWTTRESAVIEGMQGRYFLPILPLGLLLLRKEKRNICGISERRVLSGFVLMNAYLLLRIFALACLRV